MKKTFKAKVVEGRLKVEDVKGFSLCLFSLNNKEIEVSIGKPEKKRSNQQNKLYWKMLEIVCYETGNSKDDLHDYYRSKYWHEIIEIMGEKYKRLRSTTELTSEEFGVYLRDIWHNVHDNLDIDLPID